MPRALRAVDIGFWAHVVALHHDGPPRWYHTFEGHVVRLTQHFAACAEKKLWAQPLEVYLAILFHDAVYCPGAADNEERSAQEAGAAIERFGVECDAAAVLRLIRLTALHGPGLEGELPSLSEDERLFLDIDMLVLGAEEEEYESYERGVELEFTHAVFARPVFVYKRWLFMRGLLHSKVPIFVSQHMGPRYEEAARANISKRWGSPLSVAAHLLCPAC